MQPLGTRENLTERKLADNDRNRQWSQPISVKIYLQILQEYVAIALSARMFSPRVFKGVHAGKEP